MHDAPTSDLYVSTQFSEVQGRYGWSKSVTDFILKISRIEFEDLNIYFCFQGTPLPLMVVHFKIHTSVFGWVCFPQSSGEHHTRASQHLQNPLRNEGRSFWRTGHSCFIFHVSLKLPYFSAILLVCHKKQYSSVLLSAVHLYMALF